LLLEEGVGEMTFLHKSIAEYFAASFIRRLHENAAQKFYEKARGDWDRWRAILSFLSKIDKYRYYTFFLIPDTEACLLEIQGESPGDEGVLRNYLDKITKGVSLRLFDGDNSISVSTMISVHALAEHKPSFSSEEVMRYIAFKTDIDYSYRDLLAGHAPNFQRRRATRKGSVGEIGEIALSVLFKEMGYANFIRSLKIMIERMQRDVSAAREYISSENFKEDIF
jgi:hypothetical protein